MSDFKSIVIDTCVMRLYDAPADPKFKELFLWLQKSGSLVVSQKLIIEYIGTQNRNITILLNKFNLDANNKRIIKLEKEAIESFNEDRIFNYTCNIEDHYHARLVFLSPRKKLISQDNKIINDVNKFKKVDGIKPVATKNPTPDFYE